MAVNFARFKLSAAGILICIMLLFQMSVAIIRSRRDSDADEVRMRLEQLRGWNCGTPKPKLVYLLDEHKSLEAPNIVWIPNAAVLHRCEPALGNCQSYPTQTCQPRGTLCNGAHCHSVVSIVEVFSNQSVTSYVQWIKLQPK